MYRSTTYDFLLTFHINHGAISYCFRDKRWFQSKIANFPHLLCTLRRRWRGSPCNWVLVLWSKTIMMGLPGWESSFTTSLAVWNLDTIHQAKTLASRGKNHTVTYNNACFVKRWCASDVCLSRTSGLSRQQRDWDTTFKVKGQRSSSPGRFVCLFKSGQHGHAVCDRPICVHHVYHVTLAGGGGIVWRPHYRAHSLLMVKLLRDDDKY